MGSEKEIDAYYNLLKDVTRIAWEADKHGVEQGAEPFANGSRHPIGPQEPFPSPNFDEISFPDQLGEFYEAVKNGRFRATDNLFKALRGESVHPAYQRFVDPYTRDLFYTAAAAMRKGTKSGFHDDPETGITSQDNLQRILKNGMFTGVRTITYLLARDANLADAARMALMHSKVSSEDLEEVQILLGINAQHFHEMRMDIELPLPLAYLRSKGYGKTQGCPAGNKESAACREYLASKGAPIERTVIHELTGRMHTLFSQHFTQPVPFGAKCPYHT